MWNWGRFSDAFCVVAARLWWETASPDATMRWRLVAGAHRPGRSANHTGRENRLNQLINEIRWDRVPLVAGHEDACAWLGFQACRGLAVNTLDAYGRNLERYLRFLYAAGKNPHEIKQKTVVAYLRDLVKPSATEEEPDLRMANATIQQHLATLRMFYDFLVEEECCTRNPFRRGEGRSARSLVQREHKLPTIPTEEEWCRVLGEAAKEPIRNRLMLAMSCKAYRDYKAHGPRRGVILTSCSSLSSEADYRFSWAFFDHRPPPWKLIFLV
jgi:hypothetical protein